MKVGVAGGFGFLGSQIVRKLAEKGYEAIPFSRRNGVDIRVLKQVNEFLGRVQPEIVINCAAHVGGIGYNAVAPVEIYEDNLLIGLNLLRACYANNIKKLVNVIPNCTYPGAAMTFREDRWWDGEMHDSVLVYAMPRKALWVQCWAYKMKYDFNSIHIVLPNLYGPGDHFDPVLSHALGALIKKIIDAKLNGDSTIEIWGTGKPVREWGYVEDAAEGVIIAMEKHDDIEIVNVGEGVGYTITKIAEMIREEVGWEGEFLYDTSRPDGAPSKIADISKMKKVLGWQPKTPIKEGISQTVAWYMENMVGSESSR